VSRFGVGSISPLWLAGFTGNPFRAVSEEEWEEIAILPEPVYKVLVTATDVPLQIMGEPGRGKSSALRAIVREARRRQKAVAYEYIPEGSDTFQTEVEDSIWFCLDEVQRLNPRERQRLLGVCRERRTRLFVASHEDLSPLFAQAGLRIDTLTLDRPDK
jgi:hypothetical protein